MGCVPVMCFTKNSVRIMFYFIDFFFLSVAAIVYAFKTYLHTIKIDNSMDMMTKDHIEALFLLPKLYITA